MRRTAFVLACLLAIGCSEGGSAGDTGGTTPDAIADTAADIAADAAAETTADTAADTEPDPAPEVAPEVPAELPADVPPEAVPDAPGDLPADVPPVETCEVAPPLQPFSVQVPDEDGSVYGNGLVEGDATVTLKDGAGVTLRFDDGKERTLTYALPDGLEIPVYTGQRVHAYWKRNEPWWVDTVVVIWKQGWDWKPVFFFHDAAWAQGTWYDCGGQEACPSVKQLATACAPVEETCGAFVHPPVEMGLFGGTSAAEGPAVLRQGESLVNPGTPLRVRYLVSVSRDDTRMDCADYPGIWTAAAAVRQIDVSQCRCADDQDCRDGELCAPDLRRCVPNRCGPDSPCMEGYCNAYTGGCAGGPLDPCQDDGDCGLDRVCHPHLVPCTPSAGCSHDPVAGCVDNLCVVADCAPGTECSGLLDACVACAADCQCPEYGRGGWCDNRGPGGDCRACDLAKVAFGQPDVWDFFTVCASKASIDEAALEAIDPDVACGQMAPSFAKCDPGTEVVCRSDIPTYMKEHGLDDEAWGRACAFAALPFVGRVGGGFWE
ncbi:MAG: hypothetical protein FJ087_01770 [Deltaproteobacteria bacterium]|nr:hypothetical protein [Deltaproteobacteria bacterium]